VQGVAGRRDPIDVRVEIDDEVWAEEVGRLRERSPARAQAEKARREIETHPTTVPWQPCEKDGPRSTRLADCVKLYVPIGQEGASAAPYGFVFALRKVEEVLVLRMLAFGERHPTNPRTHPVYSRAHRRLHGRYPE
jgi:hypothetical protein